MSTVQVAHTSQLDDAALDAARALCERAFAGRFTAQDWEHALGGLHALVHDEGRLVAHGALVQRHLLHAGRVLRVGYVEAVATDAAHRRRGHAGAVMEALEQAITRAHDAGALCASAQGAGLYSGRGWRLWRGPTSVLSPTGVVATPEEDGCVHVLPGTPPLDLEGTLTCDWRGGDVW